MDWFSTCSFLGRRFPCCKYRKDNAAFVSIGENHAATMQLTQIRNKREAPETFVDDCGHPKNKSLHLKVTPISGCDGFEPAKPS
jgi:hypothetical protein